MRLNRAKAQSLNLLNVFLGGLGDFIAGRQITAWLGTRGQTALEKLTGMLLSILAVDMALSGLRQVFSAA
ncbi:MAG: hypothetical protein D6732_26910 [Methanobacteriota archaeon]|nr:MAG: hypothetical protein D6732_26910 [Euryarchaeota archaeon]